MAIQLSQAGRPLQATTPLGGDVLVPTRLSGSEQVSRPFSFMVDFVSTDPAIAASSILGKPVGLKLAMPSGSTRHVHGIVRSFGVSGMQRDIASYRAELVPQLWTLSLFADCRTFEKKSIPEIVTTVLRDAGISDFAVKIVGTYDPLPYVVQYRESHLAFISRLLEEAGLYYFFEHEEKKHTLVISNAHGTSIPAGSLPSVRVIGADFAQPGLDTVQRVERAYEIHTSKVQLLDHAFLRADSPGSAISSHPGVVGTTFDFLGDLGPNASPAVSRRLIEVEEAAHDRIHGSSTCVSFTVGSRVKLTGGIMGAGLDVLLLRVTHDFSQAAMIAGEVIEAEYQNGFDAIVATVKYRPPETTEAPSVQGTQTAKVVGAGGDGEIDVDKDGCVLLQFPWDNGAGATGKSEHRVHVATAWAGAGWGFVQHPRIGHEVLVEYLEGDPDRPIVTGRVYNSANKYPYELPANKTQSGVKTRSVGGGAANFNELRFEDKKGSEQVFLHAEKNMDLETEADETHWVGHDRTTTIDHDEKRHVKHDDTVTVDNHHKFTVTGGNHTVTVQAGEQTTTVKKDLSTFVEDGDRYTEIKKGSELLHVSQKDYSVNVAQGAVTIKAGAKTITLDAAKEITLKCGASSIVMKMDGTIEIKGVQVKVEGSAKVEVKGAMVKLEGQAQAEVKAAMVKVEGQAMTTIKGAIAQVTGDGMLKAAGGITMLG